MLTGRTTRRRFEGFVVIVVGADVADVVGKLKVDGVYLGVVVLLGVVEVVINDVDDGLIGRFDVVDAFRTSLVEAVVFCKFDVSVFRTLLSLALLLLTAEMNLTIEPKFE